MCGIAGFNWADENLILSMTDRLIHRGPDDAGHFIDAEVSLGHRRLSILDLSSSGRQPMHYEMNGRGSWIVFNGEIYNFRKLRGNLERRGHEFRTQTDTEVILAAYLEWDLEFVHELNGMWASAIYDPARKRLVLSRDRFGEKPLYYWFDGKRFIFASEIKAILEHEIPRQADMSVVGQYLFHGMANGGLDTFIKGVRMLAPAHRAVFDLRARTMTVQRYYTPQFGRREVSDSEFRDAVRSAVESRLIADVPISISLSSGIDSTSVAAFTARANGCRVKAFTLASTDRVGDETELLSGFLRCYPQLEMEKSYISAERFCDHYREIIYHLDEPFARQSAYVRWEVANLASRRHRKVMLNGEGADELLGGYAAFTPVFTADLLRRWCVLRFGRELAAMAKLPGAKDALRELRKKLPILGAGDRSYDERMRALRDRLSIRVGHVRPRALPAEDIKSYLFALVNDYSLPRLLNCNDKMAMANSVEGRAPFLDHELVDLIFSMDADQLLVSGWRKYPLRRAMEGLVPNEILFRRSKDSFHAPVFEYFRTDRISQRVEEIFDEARTASIFSSQRYLDEYRRFRSRKGGDGVFLFHAFLLEEWARIFDVSLELETDGR